MLLGIAGLITQVTLIVVVWRAVYSGHAAVAGITRSTAVAYAVLAVCFQSIVTPWQFASIGQRIRRG